MITPKLHDIYYTKDGRKAGNLTIVHIDDNYFATWGDGSQVGPFTRYYAMSDYGNLVDFIFPDTALARYFRTPGRAGPTHKYYDYYTEHPEAFV